MQIRTVEFKASEVVNPQRSTRLANDHRNVDNLVYYPDITQGPSVVGVIRNGGTSVVGMWDRNGRSIVPSLPDLMQETSVPDPEFREVWVNLYRCPESPHGFRLGGTVGTEQEMRERAVSTDTGNYIDTVRIATDINLNRRY